MWIIYGKPNCSECQKAKLILDMNKLPYEYLDITHKEQEHKMQEFVNKGIRVLPVVYHNNEMLEVSSTLEQMMKLVKS